MPLPSQPPAARLRSISSFEDLVGYLETDLGWPLGENSFEELTFEYDPAELNLKAEVAARILSIHQLRPLYDGQPWGIFFVEFERKRLPVVVLRNLLSRLVVNNRRAAKTPDRAAWNAGDLLFITSFGEADNGGADHGPGRASRPGRELAFAHFHQDPGSGDLPTLRVLGWDGDDTVLKLDHLARTLGQRLRWPANPRDADAWRTAWRGPFRHRPGHVITTAKELAAQLARLARNIRDAARVKLAAETERGPLTRLHRAFQGALIHDLSAEDFADTYAQTITYGLLTAAISRTDPDAGRHGTALVAENVTDMVPVTNPFLKEMLQTFLRLGGRKDGLEFDELGVHDVVELLRGNDTDLPAILRDFGNRTRGEDPVIHFYEQFLSAYNKQLKIQRGVFYTPQPVVSYIVRSVHELLQTEFGLADGLADTATWGEMLQRSAGFQPASAPNARSAGFQPASAPNARSAGFQPASAPSGQDARTPLQLPPLTDEPGEQRTISPDEPFVQILDPATGTATFLVEVIEVIYRTLATKWQAARLTADQQVAAWNDYVPRHLLPRLHAYELMMAPYAIAHMKIGLKLAETGYKFGTEERARIYLTNALEPWVKQLPLIGFDALAHEAAAVNEIKRNKRFTVVIGNPPYSNFGQLNKIPFILSLLEDYKRGLDEKKFNITDDFIKFVKLAQHTIDVTCVGVVGMITNNVFIDGLTHRRMRQSLIASFPVCCTLDLHGSVKKQDTALDGSKDENVFDIQQGVAISLWVKGSEQPSTVRHCSYRGTREHKYRTLANDGVSTGIWTEVEVEPPQFFFCPRRLGPHSEYLTWIGLKEIFAVGAGGLESMNDSLTVSFSKAGLTKVVSDLHELSITKFRSDYEVEDSAGWKLDAARSDISSHKNPAEFLREINYRPFDVRWTFYSGIQGFLSRPRFDLFRHMLQSKNIGLCAMRQSRAGEEPAFFAIRGLAGKDVVSALDRGTVFPLLLENKSSEEQTLLPGEQLTDNFNGAFIQRLNDQLQKGASTRRLPAGLTPEDIFHYIYAVFHSPGYRTRYAEFLKIDFPRLPLTGNLALFRALALLGGELTALHLLESPALARSRTEFIGGRNPVVEKVSWSRDTVWLDKAEATGFRGVPEAVWNFHVGGYQVCQKWLKDRRGRPLSPDDVAHYHKIVVALAGTIRLMGEVDETIAAHGGWPGAFTAPPPDTPHG